MGITASCRTRSIRPSQLPVTRRRASRACKRVPTNTTLTEFCSLGRLAENTSLKCRRTYRYRNLVRVDLFGMICPTPNDVVGEFPLQKRGTMSCTRRTAWRVYKLQTLWRSSVMTAVIPLLPVARILGQPLRRTLRTHTDVSIFHSCPTHPHNLGGSSANDLFTKTTYAKVTAQRATIDRSTVLGEAVQAF